MDKIIALIGPEFIGKGTVTKKLAEVIMQPAVSTREISDYHTLYTCEPEESMEIFDVLKSKIDETGARIVEIETNLIEGCGPKELEYLKKILTVNENEPSFYLVLPSHDFSKNNKVVTDLYSRAYGPVRGMMVHVSTALYNPAYDMLNPTRLYAMDGFRKPLFHADQAYTKYLDHSVLLPILSDIAKENEKKSKPTR